MGAAVPLRFYLLTVPYSGQLNRMILRILFFAVVPIILAAQFAAYSAEAKPEELLRQARSAFERGKGDEAVALASKAIAAEPENFRGYVFRAQLEVGLRRHEKAKSSA